MREKLEAQAKLLKEKENEAKALLVQEMAAQQMPSVKFDGLGRFVVKPVTAYEISDLELFTRAMLERIVDNSQHGRPLSDGLMLQKRPAKGVIEELVEAGYMQESDFASKGIEQSARMDLTFTRAKV